MTKFAVSYWELKTIVLEEPSYEIVEGKARHAIAESKGKLLLSMIEPFEESEG